ncbi:hypothetical protein ACQKGL_17020 [Ensifer adhaerens]
MMTVAATFPALTESPNAPWMPLCGNLMLTICERRRRAVTDERKASA